MTETTLNARVAFALPRVDDADPKTRIRTIELRMIVPDLADLDELNREDLGQIKRACIARLHEMYATAFGALEAKAFNADAYSPTYDYFNV